MKIQFSDLGAQHRELRTEIDRAIKKVIKESDFILGKEVDLFEKEFAKFCNTSYAVGVSSGTAALFLALLGLGIGENDEVIVPDFTYIATALAVSYTGARPVFVDIKKDTYNIDVDKLKTAITKNTKAIIPVHLYGQPADMPELIKIAKEKKIKIIEDACQAHGASIKLQDGDWKMAGSIGDVGCFSFYPSKNLGGMGDGGIITTNNLEVYKKLCKLRNYGRISKYEHEIIGYNSRLDTLQAAILRVKLRKLDGWNEKRRKAAMIYNKLFKDIDGVITPIALSSLRHVYHVYAVRVKQRDKVYGRLKRKGIGVIIHYPIPLHLQKTYQDLGYKGGDFPISQKISAEIISLPMHPYLKEEEIKFTVKAIKESLKG